MGDLSEEELRRIDQLAYSLRAHNLALSLDEAKEIAKSVILKERSFDGQKKIEHFDRDHHEYDVRTERKTLKELMQEHKNGQ